LITLHINLTISFCHFITRVAGRGPPRTSPPINCNFNKLLCSNYIYEGHKVRKNWRGVLWLGYTGRQHILPMCQSRYAAKSVTARVHGEKCRQNKYHNMVFSMKKGFPKKSFERTPISPMTLHLINFLLTGLN